LRSEPPSLSQGRFGQSVHGRSHENEPDGIRNACAGRIPLCRSEPLDGKLFPPNRAFAARPSPSAETRMLLPGKLRFLSQGLYRSLQREHRQNRPLRDLPHIQIGKRLQLLRGYNHMDSHEPAARAASAYPMSTSRPEHIGRRRRARDAPTM